MIKFAIKNIRTLKILNSTPIIKYFFVLKIDKNFNKINDDVVLEKFYNDIYVKSSTSKTTRKNRFADTNDLITNLLSEKKTYYIHDVAVSSGITSVDLYDLLTKNSINFKLFVSDKYSTGYVKENFLTTLVYDSDNNLMFGYFCCFFAAENNVNFPLTTLLFKTLKYITKPFKFDYKILLYHPALIKKINNNQITNIDFDIFSTDIKEKFDFVRAMNILNKSYFSDNKIEKAVKNILNTLKENGYLMVGRTKKGSNHVSIFQKKHYKIVLTEEFNEGSEIKDIIEKI